MVSQELITWVSVGALILTVTVPYCIVYCREQKNSAQRLKEAQELGIDKARAQFPQIDPMLCIGCGSCARVCPEHDVLAVVHGISTVVNGQRCVGHSRCEEACPVGALTVTLGDTSTREDIPIMTESHETTVPGLYIAGELGGLSLISNAIYQGKAVIDAIALELDPTRDQSMTDVLIVGAGPAGLTAALKAIELGLSYTVLDRGDPGGTILQYPRRKLVMTQPAEIPLYGRLKREEYSKEDLLEIWLDIIQRFSIDVRSGENVERLQSDGDGFTVTTSNGEYRARRVVLAMGRRGTPRKLNVPGENQAKVVYKLVDAQSYAGHHVLVVGGGDSAVEAAVALARQPGTTVSISYRKSGFFRVKKKNEIMIDTLVAEGRLTPIFESQVQSIKAESVSLETPGDPVIIPNDYVIVLVGGVPPFPLLKEMGITFGGKSEDYSPLDPVLPPASSLTMNSKQSLRPRHALYPTD